MRDMRGACASGACDEGAWIRDCFVPTSSGLAMTMGMWRFLASPFDKLRAGSNNIGGDCFSPPAAGIAMTVGGRGIDFSILYGILFRISAKNSTLEKLYAIYRIKGKFKGFYGFFPG